jgi:hypothetical protein
MNAHGKISYGPIIAFGLCLLSFQANAVEIAVSQCPKELPVQQGIELPVANGWKAVSSNRNHPLDTIRISAGEYPTEQTGFEIPTGSEKLPKGGIIAYHDSIARLAGGWHNYWAVCEYAKTSAVLARKIPENVVRCEIMRSSDPIHDLEPPEKVILRCFDETRPNAELE